MKKLTSLIWVFFAVAGRLIPHVANATPTAAITLLAGSRLNKFAASLIILTSLVISDFFLAQLHGTSVFGTWTVFTYSGFIILALVANAFLQKRTVKRITLVSISGTTFYWLWTNFGVWLGGALYAKNLQGLLECYYMALPFLRNAMFADLFWVGVLFTTYAFIEKSTPSLVKVN